MDRDVRKHLKHIDALIDYVATNKLEDRSKRIEFVHGLINLKLVMQDMTSCAEGLDDLIPVRPFEVKATALSNVLNDIVNYNALTDKQKEAIDLYYDMSPRRKQSDLRSTGFKDARKKLHEAAMEFSKRCIKVPESFIALKSVFTPGGRSRTDGVGSSIFGVFEGFYKLNNVSGYKDVIEALRAREEEKGDNSFVKYRLYEYEFEEETPIDIRKLINDFEYRIAAMRGEFSKIALKNYLERVSKTEGYGAVTGKDQMRERYIKMREMLVSDLNYHLSKISSIVSASNSEVFIAMFYRTLHRNIISLDALYGVNLVDKFVLCEEKIEEIVKLAEDENFSEVKLELKDETFRITLELYSPLNEVIEKLLRDKIEKNKSLEGSTKEEEAKLKGKIEEIQEIRDILDTRYFKEKDAHVIVSELSILSEQQKHLAPIRHYIAILRAQLDDFKVLDRRGVLSALNEGDTASASCVTTLFNVAISGLTDTKYRKKQNRNTLVKQKELLNITLEQIMIKLKEFDPQYFDAEEFKILIELQQQIRGNLLVADDLYKKNHKSINPGSLVLFNQQAVDSMISQSESKRRQIEMLNQDLTRQTSKITRIIDSTLDLIAQRKQDFRNVRRAVSVLTQEIHITKSTKKVDPSPLVGEVQVTSASSVLFGLI